MFKTPKAARLYFLLAALFLMLPALMSLYKGETGRFVVAAGKLSQEPFKGTIIYMHRHSLEGAFGFVVNKQLDLSTFDGPAFIKEADIPVFWGGPVKFPHEIYILERIDNPPYVLVKKLGAMEEENAEILSFIKASIVAGEGKYKVLAGYAGWGHLQLESEFIRGNWTTVNPDLALVFSLDVDQAESWARQLSKANKERPLKETKIF